MKICIMCGIEKEDDEFYWARNPKSGRPSNVNRRRPECKSCNKIKRDKKNAENRVETRIKNMAHGIIARTSYASHKPKNKSYIGVENRLGSNEVEVKDTIRRLFYDEIKSMISEGKNPSIDRIKSESHYEIDNIRILDLGDNVRLGLANAHKASNKPILFVDHTGTAREYTSVSEASRILGIARSSFYRWAKETGPYGQQVEFIKGADK